MAIKISRELISKLPEQERANCKTFLLDKSGGICFLCATELNEAGEDIVPDHDIPESSMDGETVLENLNLVHSSCNSFKRNHPTVDVRPYLKLLRQIKREGGFQKYDQVIKLLEINPKPVEVVIKENKATFRFNDDSKINVDIFEERNKEGVFRFCYLEVPQNVIYNDNECQPRAIKEQHLWQIYNDINRNPLHEAPACRLEKVTNTENLYRLLMFDDQHKTLSFWVSGRVKIVIKIYLNLTREAAVRLVNSIQSKIKKLPLSPFELAAKMSDEWQDRIVQYEQELGTENASEDGFIKYVEKDEQARAKSAFIDALYQSIIDNEIDFLKLISKPNQKPSTSSFINEGTFKNKVLKPLLHTVPLKENFIDGARLREREKNSIIRILNMVYKEVFKEGIDLSPQDEIKIKRFLYQSSLKYVFSMIKSVIENMLYIKQGRGIIEKDISEENWTIVQGHIHRLFSHPVWVTPFEKSKKMKALKDALIKNQEAEKVFGDVGLKNGYVAAQDPLDPDWMGE